VSPAGYDTRIYKQFRDDQCTFRGNQAALQEFLSDHSQEEQMMDMAANSRDEEDRPKSRRGFAAMDPEKVSQIARKGGKAAHKAGTAHRFTASEAKSAGKKGGLAPHKSRGRSVEKDD
jgi:uncharacterized protein